LLNDFPDIQKEVVYIKSDIFSVQGEEGSVLWDNLKLQVQVFKIGYDIKYRTIVMQCGYNLN